ncbi:MAG: gas vesicle protein [Desulfarculaceae bacterium]|nr:gas vesicle protein [Desulfarculaceae bacterium]MCF8049469.1 gas vesicle protein [Desulfarculaceae bacterium]MCF8064147.1 gas vesicle protein [Desulfarculaceae bacterium]MCF8097137.1 gas vesicle protein [Desulfarculaceae bacterium]
MSESEYRNQEDLSLCEALDRILHKGAVIMGEIIISVADVDLVYLGLQLVVCSVDTAIIPEHDANKILGSNI